MLNDKIKALQDEIKTAVENLEIHINLYTPQQVAVYRLAKDIIHRLEQLKYEDVVEEQVEVPKRKQSVK